MNTIPRDVGDESIFDSYAKFVSLLWEQLPDDLRVEYGTPENYATCCNISEDGVFRITTLDDGRVRVVNVG